jgi:hypothetical protein
MSNSAMKRIVLTVFFVVGLSGLNNAHAERSCHAGGSLGYVFGEDASAELNELMASHGWSARAEGDEADRQGYKFMVGCRFQPVGVELSFIDLGGTSLSISGTVSDLDQLEADFRSLEPASARGITAVIFGNYSLPYNLDIVGRFGLFRWNAKQTLEFNGANLEHTAQGTGPTFGISLETHKNKAYGLRLDWDRYAVDYNWLDTLMLGVVYRFR